MVGLIGQPQSSDARIVRALRRKAERGAVNAARELREWRGRERAAAQSPEAWMYLLTPKDRAWLRERIDPGVLNKLVVVARENDHETMLNHALIQGRRRYPT
jgi:hypothetical protein